MQKPRVIEIQVRMDCNGCVQKIKKALNGITGIHDIFIDFPQQKITIIGTADPHRILKAIKKTRKSAVICLHTLPQPDQPDQPTEPMPEDGPPPPEPTTPPHEPTKTEPPPPPELTKEPPPPENPPSEPNPSPETANSKPSQPKEPFRPGDREETHVIHHHPTDHGYGYAHGPNFQQGSNGQWNSYHGGPEFRGSPCRPPRPVYVTHSYNTYMPPPYVTEYAYSRSPPRYPRYDVSEYNTHYSMSDHNTHYSTADYRRDYDSRNNGNGGNITSIFSEENPNACRIV
ncbi:hypothetical protein OROGR_014464 [Orobanche gracilis]